MNPDETDASGGSPNDSDGPLDTLSGPPNASGRPPNAADGQAAAPEVLVRPKGYVEDRAVVRRIGDRDLYLGNALAADPASHDRSFDFVLSATSDERPLTTHHRPLTDGRGNDWSAFESAADTARRLYRQEGSVLVHCKAGLSRSTTLLATALAAEEDRRFREALGLVQEARPFAMPHPALHELAVVYLAANSASALQPA